MAYKPLQEKACSRSATVSAPPEYQQRHRWQCAQRGRACGVLKAGHYEVKASLELANEGIKHFYDQNHCTPEDIQVGDKVWLSHQNIETD
jgi:hypothetical protein